MNVPDATNSYKSLMQENVLVPGADEWATLQTTVQIGRSNVTTVQYHKGKRNSNKNKRPFQHSVGPQRLTLKSHSGWWPKVLSDQLHRWILT